jgi:hypothetical protein
MYMRSLPRKIFAVVIFRSPPPEGDIRLRYSFPAQRILRNTVRNRLRVDKVRIVSEVVDGIASLVVAHITVISVSIS